MVWGCKYCSVTTFGISSLLEGLHKSFPIPPQEDQAWYMLLEVQLAPLRQQDHLLQARLKVE